MLNVLRKVLLVCALTLLIVSTGAYAESWTSFKYAEFDGVDITPAFATDTLTYTVAFSDIIQPTITIGGIEHDIAWIQGFYTLSNNGINTFYAGGDNIVDPANPKNVLWKWDTNPNISSPNNYVVAGWSAQGTEDRIVPNTVNDNKSFTYTDFMLNGTSVIYGLHVGYYDEGQEKNITAFYKPTGNVVPEVPASVLFGIGGPMLGAVSLLRKRFGR
ncbi:MAG: hypothetical protein ABFD83_04120 [Armatimonadota bacterium]